MFSKDQYYGLSKAGLRFLLFFFFLAIAFPMGFLIYKAISQLKWEAFYQHSLIAEEFASRIDKEVGRLIDSEESRSFTDYHFLNISGDETANFLQRSPLSAYPVNAQLPGLIGYFQIDTAGVFSTPFLPVNDPGDAKYGIPAAKLAQRGLLQQRIFQILRDNRLVRKEDTDENITNAQLPKVLRGEDVGGGIASSLDAIEGRDGYKAAVASKSKESKRISVAKQAQKNQPETQLAFDKLTQPRRRSTEKQKPSYTLGKLEEIQLDSPYQKSNQPASPAFKKDLKEDRAKGHNAISELPDISRKSQLRKERSALPEQEKINDQKDLASFRIRIFESEVDAFQVSLLDSGHLVLFRKVWRDGQRYIQGALIEPKTMFQATLGAAFNATKLSQMSNLLVAFQGDIFSVFGSKTSSDYLASAKELQGTLLYQTRLAAPFAELQLIFSINQLPSGPGRRVIFWVTGLLATILMTGLYLMYRMILREINSSKQQQDFVSSISHELKTPLTSIRMYGEMLREGWVDEGKKKTYYAYIHDESERLSRLITDILQLSRISRNDLKLDLKNFPVAELNDNIQSKVASQLERAGFNMQFNCEGKAAQTIIKVDADAFTQVFINLIDNAIKFSKKQPRKQLDLTCMLLPNGTVQFCVRDYGIGIVKDQVKKIFKLFYRSETELTRETVGTGIGLALVKRIVTAMGGNIDVVNQDPGTEFRLSFPVCRS